MYNIKVLTFKKDAKDVEIKRDIAEAINGDEYIDTITIRPGQIVVITEPQYMSLSSLEEDINTTVNQSYFGEDD